MVAADFSPKRREVAGRLGATVVVDPRAEPAIEAWQRVDGSQRLHLFEAVGVPGMIDQAMSDAPRRSQITVVGACMEPDTIHPLTGLSKELSLQFCFAYDFAGGGRHAAKPSRPARLMWPRSSPAPSASTRSPGRSMSSPTRAITSSSSSCLNAFPLPWLRTPMTRPVGYVNFGVRFSLKAVAPSRASGWWSETAVRTAMSSNAWASVASAAL